MKLTADVWETNQEVRHIYLEEETKTNVTVFTQNVRNKHTILHLYLYLGKEERVNK